MSAITASPEIDISELEGAPDEPWLRAFNEQYNELGRQVVANINQNTPFGNCPTSLIKPYDFVHGVSQTIANPLGVPITGVYPVSCVGVSVDSTGKPTRAVYNLATPKIEWHPATNSDGSVVTAYFSTDGMTSGYVGERTSDFRPPASAVTLATSGAIQNLGSVTIGPGDFDIDIEVGHSLGGATGATIVRGWINTASASDPGATENGNTRFASPQVPTAASSSFTALTKMRVSPTASTTYYLSANMVFSGGSNATAFGRITATRATPYLTGVRGRVGLLFLGGS